ncbi:MAG: acetyl-CoA carboxylase biotin carboxyl carrier protein subunit [Dehalococcoidia bacterium]
MPTLTPQDIESIVQQFESGDWAALEVRSGDSELFLGRHPGARPSWTSQDMSPAAAAGSAATAVTSPATAAAATAAAAASPAVACEPPPADAGTPHGHVIVPAPSMGIFYRAAKPGAPPFVEVGHIVKPDTELCLVEVMKLFTTINAGVHGRIEKILVGDGAAIELGQPLFVIDTNV